MWHMGSFSRTHTQMQTHRRPACAVFLFMSGDFYREHAVLCSPVGSSPDFVLLYVLVMHHPRHYMVYNRPQPPPLTRDSLLSCLLLFWKLIWKRGHPCLPVVQAHLYSVALQLKPIAYRNTTVTPSPVRPTSHHPPLCLRMCPPQHIALTRLSIDQVMLFVLDA